MDTPQDEGGRFEHHPNSNYTDELARKVIERLSDGEPLTRICRDLGIHRGTFRRWRKRDAELDAAFLQARDDGHDAIADECLEISDAKGDDPGCRKVRVYTRLQLLAKWDPRRWGDKLQTENRTVQMTHEEFLASLK